MATPGLVDNEAHTEDAFAAIQRREREVHGVLRMLRTAHHARGVCFILTMSRRATVFHATLRQQQEVVPTLSCLADPSFKTWKTQCQELSSMFADMHYGTSGTWHETGRGMRTLTARHRCSADTRRLALGKKVCGITSLNGR